MNRSLYNLKFPRSLDEAFRTPRYAVAIEVAYLPAWRRVLRALWSWL